MNTFMAVFSCVLLCVCISILHESYVQATAARNGLNRVKLCHVENICCT